MLFAVLLVSLAQTPAHAKQLTPVWVELGEGGRALARVIVDSASECPSVRIREVREPMSVRQPVPPGFRPVCEFALPANLKAGQVNGKPLTLPRPDPARIVVLGDTGCRIQGARLQDCNDAAKWPFERNANEAAAARADLVIHVGDYLYRESPCPPNAQAQCGGTPSGDNFEAWDADFFKPAANLLGAAPWIFTRGNHENCQRSWRGWFYYLDPRPWTGACAAMSPPYSVELGKFQAIDFDSSAVNENQIVPEQLDGYTKQLAGLHARNAWLVAHHPFWAVRAGAPGAPPEAQTLVLQQAWDKASPQGIEVVLSGHTHLFELLSYGSSRPLQVVAGDGGTNLADPVPDQVNGMDVHGVMVTASENQRAFGYTLFTRQGSGWKMSLRDLDRRDLINCKINLSQAQCAGQVVKVDRPR
jgi:predicted phosphodiesterase